MVGSGGGSGGSGGGGGSGGILSRIDGGDGGGSGLRYLGGGGLGDVSRCGGDWGLSGCRNSGANVAFIKNVLDVVGVIVDVGGGHAGSDILAANSVAMVEPVHKRW